MEERLHARGHDNVTARHGSTLEVTTDDWLTPAGDCIVGVDADRAPADFEPAFIEACRSPDATIRIELAAAGYRDIVEAAGSPDLTFRSRRSAVIRTSQYVDDRTIAIDADAAAADLDRDLVAAVAAGAGLEVTVTVTPIGQG